MPLEITCPAFADNGMVPVKYTCDADEISPPLKWSNPPAGVKCFALLCDDPDAPAKVWVHWIIFNIPADVKELPENVPKVPKLEDGTIQGLNDSGETGYGGPCPPSGIHRYFFKLYALDTMLNLMPGVKKPEFLNALKGHILAEAKIMGKYGKQ